MSEGSQKNALKGAKKLEWFTKIAPLGKKVINSTVDLGQYSPQQVVDVKHFLNASIAMVWKKNQQEDLDRQYAQAKQRINEEYDNHVSSVSDQRNSDAETREYVSDSNFFSRSFEEVRNLRTDLLGLEMRHMAEVSGDSHNTNSGEE